MLIACPSCASEYEVDAAHLAPSGRTVRCAACRATFFAEPAEDDLDGAALASDWADAAADEPLSVPAESRRGREPGAKSQGSKTPGSKTKPSRAGKRAGTPAPTLAGRLGRALTAPVRAVPPALLLALLLGGLCAGAVAARARIVALAPDTARLYAALGLPVNLRGLALEGVQSHVVTQGGETALVVEGEIANLRTEEAGLPRLALSVRDETGQALYSWTVDPPRATLPAGQSARFRARLNAPPDVSRQVLVRFAPPGNGPSVAAGMR